MLNAGADLNAQDSRGNTPLHYAAVQSNIKCMETLINKNAEYSIKNNDGLYAIDIATTKEFRTQFENTVEKKRADERILKKDDMGNKSTKVDSAGFKLLECKESTLESGNIGPKDFKVHGLLGKGSFGEVYLVEKIDTGTIYAMKVLHKTNIISILT